MNRTLIRGAMTTTALGLGLAALAAAPSASAQAVPEEGGRDCLALVDAIEAHLDDREDMLDPRQDDVNAPNLSHLVEAARRFALQGEEERCLAVVEDAAGYLDRDTPEVDRGGLSVLPDEPPPLQGEEGEPGYQGVRDPGEPGFRGQALSEDEVGPRDLTLEEDEPGYEGPLDEEGTGGPSGYAEDADDDEGEGLDELAEEGEVEPFEEEEDGVGVLDNPDRAWRPAVSPVAPPAPGVGEGTAEPEPSATFADNDLLDLRADEIVGHALVNNWGDEIGYVEDVVAPADDPEDVYAVVSEDGESGVGGGEHVISLDRLRLANERAVQWRVRNDGTGNVPGLEELPPYDPEAFRSLARDEERTLGEVVGAAAGR